LLAWACIVPVLCLLACAQPGSSPATAHGHATAAAPVVSVTPALWRAEGPEGREGTLYLLGSVHVGRTRLDFGPEVATAWTRSEELVVEVDLTVIGEDAMTEMTYQYAELAPPLTLRDIVSGETWGQVSAYAALRGLNVADLAGLKPWFAALTIVQIELRLAGYGAEHGVDRYFMDAAGTQKPIVALETLASQLDLLNRLPASLQESMLKDALQRVDGFPEEAAALVDAWGDGDEDKLEALVFEPVGELPELEVFYDLVFTRRNRSMAARLLELGGDGKTRFVVVGAGHLVGDQGVPALLARAGYGVTRIH